MRRARRPESAAPWGRGPEPGSTASPRYLAHTEARTGSRPRCAQDTGRRPGYEPRDSCRGERPAAARTGQTSGTAPECATLASLRAPHWDLLARAIEDPSLAAVIDTYDPGIPAEKRRQFLCANAWYVNLYHLYRAGLLDGRELFGRLREIFRNPVMRDYWEASEEQRATLEHTSDEARIGRMIDGLIRDLDEADTDEWWVVGTPPSS
ncbi:DUF6082 family protein [Streptomyces seoulensis]